MDALWTYYLILYMINLLHVYYSPPEEKIGCGEDFAKLEYFLDKGQPEANPKPPHPHSS